MANKNSNNEPVFTISGDEIDVQKIMETIRERVEKKRAAGIYDKYNLDKVTGLEVAEAKNDEDFLRYYLKIIRKTYLLNIDDFEIPSKGGILGRPLVWLKKIIWNMLKFYTYRMFSQQREFNLQIVHTLIALNGKIDKNHRELMRKLEESAGKPDGGKK